MDYSAYEVYDFDHASAFNMSTGNKGRSYQDHWHSYGEIVLVGPGRTNIYRIGKNTYELVPDDLVIVWPMECISIGHTRTRSSGTSSYLFLPTQYIFVLPGPTSRISP